jgi:hypothetical protein
MKLAFLGCWTGCWSEPARLNSFVYWLLLSNYTTFHLWGFSNDWSVGWQMSSWEGVRFWCN